MEQVIYADILIFFNIIITFILLLTTSQFIGITPSAARLVTGSFVGGAYSLIILAPPLNAAAVLATRAAMCLTLICIVFDPKKVRVFFKLFLVFILCNFLYAGIVYAVFYLISPDFLTVNNGFAYYNISVVSVIAVTGIAYAVIVLMKKTVLKNTGQDIIYDVEIFNNGKTYRSKALLDTGNVLTDPFNGRPVIVINREAAVGISDTDIFEADEENIRRLRIHYLPVSSVSGKTLMPSFPVEKMTVYKAEGKKDVICPQLAVTEEPLGGDEYSILLNKEIL